MKRAALISGVSFLTALLLLPATVAIADHRPGHPTPPGQGGGNGDGGDGNAEASIDLINCDNGEIATWADKNLTYQIVNVSGVSDAEIQAVRDGVERWDGVGGFTLTEQAGPGADITIEVFFKIIPGSVLGFAVVECDASDNIAPVQISLGIKGLNDIGINNLAAHETGHGLGLGHSDRNGDLMDARFEKKTEGKVLVCISNLDVLGLQAGATDPTVIEAADWACAP